MSFVCCDGARDSCVCCLHFGHDGPHVCQCLGAWTEEYVVRFPRRDATGLSIGGPILPEPEPGSPYRMTGEFEWEPIKEVAR